MRTSSMSTGSRFMSAERSNQPRRYLYRGSAASTMLPAHAWWLLPRFRGEPEVEVESSGEDSIAVMRSLPTPAAEAWALRRRLEAA